MILKDYEKLSFSVKESLVHLTYTLKKNHSIPATFIPVLNYIYK